MQDEVKNKGLRLICSCGTIYHVCEMPMDVLEVVKKVNSAKCPTCSKSGKTAGIYVETVHEREER